MDHIVRYTLPHIVRALLACGLLCAIASSVQAQNQITENPEGAAKLRRIWFIKGWGQPDTLVGINAGPLGDINADGFDDFSVSIGTDAKIFLGGDPPTTTPVFSLDSAAFGSVRSPVVGNFLGDSSRMMIGFIRSLCPADVGACFIRVLFYHPDADSVLRWSGYEWYMGEQPHNFALHAADLDRDGADELVVVNTQDDSTRVRIYRGGDDFSLMEPTMTMTMESAGFIYTSYSDFDGDGFVDFSMGTLSGTVSRLKFWWGSSQSPWSWSDVPDRIILQTIDSIVPSYPAAYRFMDYNGDGQQDLFGQNNAGTDFYLWLSDRSVDFRTRRYDATDIDLHIPRASGGGTYGYVADSLQRYMMLPIMPPWDEPDDSAKGLGGGADGPNMTFDAWFPGNEGPLLSSWDVGDVDGNGWLDALIHSSNYGGPGVGIALIIAGGPYIPSDDPTVDVRRITTGEHVAAIHIWPNPVWEELHIAWRGDLTRRPARMLIHDAAGRAIADIPLHFWKGEARWLRAAAPAGAYIITIIDTNGETLATSTIIAR